MRIWTDVACVVIAVLAVMTWVQASYWQDSRTLFTHADQVTEGNYIAHQNLGALLETEQHDLDGALQLYRAAAKETPKFARTRIHETIANALLQQGNNQEALAEARQAINIDPFSTTAYDSMGLVMLANGEEAEAAKYFQLAVQFDPDNFGAQIDYGTTLVKLRRWDEAIAQLTPVARLVPRRYLARTYLARALAGRGDYEQAIAQLRQILELNPNYRAARELLHEIESEQKQRPGLFPNQPF